MESKRTSGRIAARKAKQAELAINHDQLLAKSRRRVSGREQSKQWSASEKEKILEALKFFGTADITNLRKAVPYRSEEDVKYFVEREKVKMTQVYREVGLPDGRVKVSWGRLKTHAGKRVGGKFKK